MSIKIFIEVDFDVEFHEYDNGTVRLEVLRFVGHQQNVLQYLSPSEQDAAQQALEDEVEKAAIDKVQRLLEQKAMRADIAREFQQEALAERQAQRGVQLA
jgi:hypothetical protein